MAGIYLYSSNRLETLASRFIEIIRDSPLEPLKKETVLVQSRGMARWLAMHTASRLKIWANCECPFPNTFINEIYRLLLSDIPDAATFHKEYILWHIMALLSETDLEKRFPRLAQYLASGDEMKLYQLARETADLFDQYTLFRPEMILDWEAGKDAGHNEHNWQPWLWCRLLERLSRYQPHAEKHRARLLQCFREEFSNRTVNSTLLPPRISVFGISSLPPYHLQVLTSLARSIDVHFFIMNPCMEYWFDIVADRDIVKISRREKTDQEKLHLQQGNSLLASMGHAGRNFLAMLQELPVEENDHFVDNGAESLLTCIQQDILLLRENRDITCNAESALHQAAVTDNSITFHSCHSPMREVEVLHDLLLDLFNAPNPADRPEPREVLVMAPEIDEYAHLIRAVFDAVDKPQQKIPYSISDQSYRRRSKFIETFFEILRLSSSRFTTLEVMGILESAAVRNRFSITESDLAIIENWIRETNIRWGIDPNHKDKLELPSYPENTWSYGMDRLLLGYAMPGYDQKLFHNILPYDHIEGDNIKTLSGLLDFTQTLFDLSRKLQQSHTLSDWSEILMQVSDRMLMADAGTEAEERILHGMIYGLRELQDKSRFQQKIDLQVIRSYLTNSLDERFSPLAGATGFLAGGVTFCSMLPMRAIPFKVICLLGLNDGRYPRAGRKRSFDLMALNPRPGDRSSRYDDRYLFLETLVSARNRLMISFVGQSIKDGSQYPPSVLVSELMDYIDRNFSVCGNLKDSSGSLSKVLTTFHHLQPFHPVYFQPDSLSGPAKFFSYSAENHAAATALHSAGRDISCKPAAALEPPPDEFREVDLQELIRFYSHPCRYFLLKRVGIAPIEESSPLETREPFGLEGLSRYKLASEILDFLRQEMDCDRLYHLKKAAGELPHGRIGKIHFSRLVSELRSFHDTYRKILGDLETVRIELDLAIGDFRLTGLIDNVTQKGIIQYRYAKLTAKDVIRNWICHLAINTLTDEQQLETAGYSLFACRSGIFRYDFVSESRKYLEFLLQQYWRGLAKPLVFFPNSSYSFAKALKMGKDRQQAFNLARQEWEGDSFRGRGEKYDPYNQICCQSISHENHDFAELAQGVFLPVLENQEKIRPADSGFRL